MRLVCASAWRPDLSDGPGPSSLCEVRGRDSSRPGEGQLQLWAKRRDSSNTPTPLGSLPWAPPPLADTEGGGHVGGVSQTHNIRGKEEGSERQGRGRKKKVRKRKGRRQGLLRVNERAGTVSKDNLGQSRFRNNRGSKVSGGRTQGPRQPRGQLQYARAVPTVACVYRPTGTCRHSFVLQ